MCVKRKERVQDFQNLALHVAHKFFQLLIKKMEVVGFAKLSRIPTTTSFSQKTMYIEMMKCRSSPRRQCFQL
jgi:hypothetical protein